MSVYAWVAIGTVMALLFSILFQFVAMQWTEILAGNDILCGQAVLNRRYKRTRIIWWLLYYLPGAGLMIWFTIFGSQEGWRFLPLFVLFSGIPRGAIFDRQMVAEMAADDVKRVLKLARLFDENREGLFAVIDVSGDHMITEGDVQAAGSRNSLAEPFAEIVKLLGDSAMFREFGHDLAPIGALPFRRNWVISPGDLTGDLLSGKREKNSNWPEITA